MKNRFNKICFIIVICMSSLFFASNYESAINPSIPKPIDPIHPNV